MATVLIYLTSSMQRNAHLVSVGLCHKTMTQELTISTIHNVTAVSMTTHKGMYTENDKLTSHL